MKFADQEYAISAVRRVVDVYLPKRRQRIAAEQIVKELEADPFLQVRGLPADYVIGRKVDQERP